MQNEVNGELAADIANLEQAIEDNQAKRDLAAALARLDQNPDFQKIVLDGFLKDHAVRQVLLKAHPGYQGEQFQKMFDINITGIGVLKQYFVAISTEGLQAEQSILVDEETLETLRQEDAE